MTWHLISATDMALDTVPGLEMSAEHPRLQEWATYQTDRTPDFAAVCLA